VNKIAAALLLLGLCLPALADDQLYEPKYLGGRRLETVCSLAQMVSGASVQYFSELKLVRLSGSQPAMTKAEDILKRFDVPQPAPKPQPQITFTVYMVRASMNPPGPDVKPRPVPAELESALTEMKRSFAYSSYTLLDTLVSPVNGHVQLSGVLPQFYTSTVQAYFYTLSLSSVRLSEDAKSISIDPFNFSVKIPYGAGNEMKEGTSGISTTLSMEPGQKLVVGKIKVQPKDDTDIFLVLTAVAK
jgi:hypothetical protein